MVADAFPQQSRDWAAELYEVLRAVDPSRWRDARAAELKAAMEALAERGRLLLAEADSRAGDPLRQRVSELTVLMESRLPATAATSAQVRAAWVAFRGSAVPAYEALASALKERQLPVPSLRPTNYTRSLFHLASGIAAVLALEFVFDQRGRILAAGLLCGVYWTLEITRRLWPGWNETLLRVTRAIAHPHERFRVNSSTWFLTALLALALLASQTVAGAAVAVLAVADPAAAFFGRRYGRTRIRAGRTLEGSLAFLASGALAAFAVVAWDRPELGFASWALVSLAAAFSGALAELFLPFPDDNLTIPLAAAAGASLVLWVLGLG